MLRIGLTGGVASGKTAAAQIFARLGAPVVDADELARAALAPGSPALARVADALGREYLAADGSLDRARLRRAVFARPELRARLEAIVHPEVRERLAERLAGIDAPYVVLVVPLLVETGYARLVDRVLVVDCPEELQVRRLLARDGGTEAGARRMLAAQASRAERLAAADDVIVNDAGLDRLRAAVAGLHEHYLALAAQPR